MSRLKTVQPRIASGQGRLAPGLGDGRNRPRRRDDLQPWRRWYKTAKWQRLRWKVLVRDAFTCRDCGAVKADTSQLVCDHVEPHDGDEMAFWSGPFQTLCKVCHDIRKQRAERRASR